MSEQIRSREPPFFVVSWERLVVLSVLTAQLYQVYWLYKVWSHIQARSGRRLQPVAQCIMAFVSMFFLLRRVQVASGGVPRPIAGEALVLFFIVLKFFDNAPLPASLIASLSVLPLLPLQSAMVDANFSTTGASGVRAGWSRGELAWVAFGIVYSIVRFAVPA